MTQQILEILTFAINWENPQWNKRGFDFGNWDPILEHKGGLLDFITKRGWDLWEVGELCNSWFFFSLAYRVISPGTACQAAVYGWGQSPSRVSQSWRGPGCRKWLFISCNRTVTWAARSPFPKVRPRLPFCQGTLQVKYWLCQSHELWTLLTPNIHTGRKLQLLGCWLALVSIWRTCSRGTICMSANMFI